MLDVHPPHHSPNTWRDFILHIATICVGLLIAIGLEQTVEAIHRHHEHEQLIEAMRSEARRNAKYLRVSVDFALLDMRWDHQAAQAVAAAKPSGAWLTVTLPPLPNTYPTALASRAVWSVARASGKVALLPEALAETYDRLDLEAEFSMSSSQNLDDSTARYEALLAQLGLPNPLQGTITLPAAQQANLVAALDLQYSLESDRRQRLLAWLGASEAVADGVEKQEDIWPYLRRHLREFQQQ